MAAFLKHHERHLATASFFAGFLWDQLTLSRIDLWIDNLILSSYLAIATAAIIVFHALDTARFKNAFLQRYAGAIPLAMQFAFGGLFSGFFFFYSRSGSLLTSWPFLLVLGGILVGNEFLRSRYHRLAFQVSVWYFAIFSYALYALPILFDRIDDTMFFASGLTSLAIAGCMLAVFRIIAHARLVENRTMIIASVIGIFSAINILYIANILPPIPLSLKTLLVAHDVDRERDGYHVRYERIDGIVLAGADFTRTFHRFGDEPIYVYSAIFAPTNIRTDILHRWMYFDQRRDSWIATDTMHFPIIGGRDGGYRGYSFKRNVVPGLWRVEVINGRGQVLGRVTFTVVTVHEPATLKSAYYE